MSAQDPIIKGLRALGAAHLEVANSNTASPYAGLLVLLSEGYDKAADQLEADDAALQPPLAGETPIIYNPRGRKPE